MVLNNRILLQYGFVGSVGNNYTVKYPLTYSSRCCAITVSTVNMTTTIGARTTSNFKIYCTDTTNIDWIAIGY